jgi:hypothetical protein
MGLVEAILEASSLVQEIKDKAVSETRVDEARRLLRRVLHTKFPDLEAMPEIDAIHGIEVLESLLDEVLASQDSARVRQVIAAAASPK